MTNTAICERIKSEFLKLLQAKSFEKLSFKELAEASGMSRQNLYHYYTSKEEVLVEIIEDSFEDMYEVYENIIEQQKSFSAEILLRKLCLYIIDHRDLATITITPKFETILFNKYIAFAKRMLGRTARFNQVDIVDDQALHFLAIQIASAIFFPAREWIHDGMRYPIEKIIIVQSRVLDRSLLETLRKTQQKQDLSRE